MQEFSDCLNCLYQIEVDGLPKYRYPSGGGLYPVQTYVYVTTDLGGSFRSIAGNLPKGEVVRTISEDLKNPDVLYLGTETGLWVTTDRGKQWTRVKANLPTGAA